MSCDFFTYESELPDGVGFGIFGPWHIAWLLALGAGVRCLLRLHARLPERKRRSLEYAVSFSLVILIVLRSVYAAAVGAYFLYELPLHLCSVTGVLCAVHCAAKAEWAGQVIYAIGLPGTLLALLFPDWGSYPAVHFITVEGFLFHAGILLYVLSQLYSGKIVPEKGKLRQVFVFLAAYLIPVYVFDRVFSVNYMFLSRPSEGSPLELLLRWFGEPGYPVAYGALIVLCVYAMVAVYGLLRR